MLVTNSIEHDSARTLLNFEVQIHFWQKVDTFTDFYIQKLVTNLENELKNNNLKVYIYVIYI